MDGGEVVSSLSERILGRTSQEDVVDPATGEPSCARNDAHRRVAAERIEKAGVEAVKIRSVLTCDARQGVCGRCYGRDLARGTPVNVGEAVGVIAAQSIGEPGTQLTMRTFHIGGAAQRGRAVGGRGDRRRHGEDRQPQRCRQQPGRAHRDEPQLRDGAV
jgi:DNA-directed RNA polymerase subunit beta'